MDEVTRYQLFCQFRAEIRGSHDHLIVGIDVAKDKHHAFFGTATGKTLWRRLIFSNDLSGYQCLVEQVDLLMALHRLKEVTFGLEPTGNYHKPLANWLLINGYHLVLVTGKAIKDNRQSMNGRWDKNDTKDSANAGDLVSQGKCQFYEQPEPHIITLRNLLSVRKRLKRQEHGLRMQIRNGLIVKYFPEMDKFWGNSLEENLAIVRWYLDPRKITSTDFEQFVQHVTTNSRGGRQVHRLRCIYDAAKDSVGLPLDEASIFEADLLVERYHHTKEQIDQTMQQIVQACENLPQHKLLMTIPGFGPYISAMVIAAIGNPHRFPSSSQVLRLAGLDLNANRSGKSSNTKIPKISKQGDVDLRYALYQAALIGSYHNKALSRRFARMLKDRAAEQGIKTKMRIKLSAKLLVVAWTMLKNNEAFDANRFAA
jgi:transposase